MANLDAKIQMLTGTFTDQDAMDEFLENGVRELHSAIPAKYFEPFATITTLNNSITTLSNTEDYKIFSVKRKDADAGIFQPCKRVDSSLVGKLTDSSSIYYATAFSPAYYIEADILYVVPTTTANQTASVYRHTYSGLDADGSTSIPSFPTDLEHLVILYAACRVLQNKMASKVDNLPSDISEVVIGVVSTSLPSYTAPTAFVMPVAPAGVDVSFTEVGTIDSFVSPVFSAPSLGTISAMSLPNAPVAPSVAEKSVTITGTAPTYIAPVVSIDSAPSITSLTITSVIPVPPVLDSTSIDTSGLTNPTFTPPVMNAPDWTDTNTWISTEEDSEMLAARVQEIQTKVQEFNSRLAEATSQFDKENTILQKDLQVAMQNANTFEQGKLSKYGAELQSYQASVSSEVQEWQLDYNKQIATWESEKQSALQKYQADMQNSLNTFNKENTQYQALLQKDLQDAQLKESKEGRDLQKYSQELQSYQAQVNTEVQKWTNETFGKAYQEWVQKYQGQLSEYGSDLQKETSKVSASVNDYQAKVSKALQTYQAETGFDLSKYQSELQAYTQKYTNDLQQNTTTFNSDLQKYSSEIQKVSTDNQSALAKFGQDLANYNAKIQKHSVDYQWLQGQYMQCKQDYNQGLQITMTGKHIPEEQRLENKKN